MSPSNTCPLTKLSASSADGTCQRDVAIPPTKSILEIRASTRPYPSCQKDTSQELWNLRPSKTSQTTAAEGLVLDHNVVFVDTPGYGSSNDVSPFEDMTDVV
jgi:hypothetical protein